MNYTERELISFGNFLLDKFIDEYNNRGGISSVGHWDLHNWKETNEYRIIQKQKERNRKLKKIKELYEDRIDKERTRTTDRDIENDSNEQTFCVLFTEYIGDKK